MVDSKVLITIDASDLQRVAHNIRAAAAQMPMIVQSSLSIIAGQHAFALREVTPLGTRKRDDRPEEHLRDSYLVTGAGTVRTIVTTQADKWNIVNAEFAYRPIWPVIKQALSWPGMQGPYPENDWGWGPGPGYDVPPVANSKRRRGEKIHTSMNLLSRSEDFYGGEAMDLAIMQDIADAMVVAVAYGPASFVAHWRRQAQAAAQPRDVRGRFMKWS